MAEEYLVNDQKKLVDRLVEVELKRYVAKTLVVIASKDGAGTKEIENATDLRQPEVSMGTGELRERGWVGKRKVKKEGVGRPVHVYSLDNSMDEIIDEIGKKEKERIEEIKENIEKIEEMKDLAESVL